MGSNNHLGECAGPGEDPGGVPETNDCTGLVCEVLHVLSCACSQGN